MIRIKRVRGQRTVELAVPTAPCIASDLTRMAQQAKSPKERRGGHCVYASLINSATFLWRFRYFCTESTSTLKSCSTSLVALSNQSNLSCLQLNLSVHTHTRGHTQCTRTRMTRQAQIIPSEWHIHTKLETRHHHRCCNPPTDMLGFDTTHVQPQPHNSP